MAVTLAAKRPRTEPNGADVQARLSSLKEDFDLLQKDVRGLMSDVSGAASGQVSGVVNSAIDTASEAVERAGQWSSENLNGVRQAVRTQPLAACVLSMSAGAIIGALLRR